MEELVKSLVSNLITIINDNLGNEHSTRVIELAHESDKTFDIDTKAVLYQFRSVNQSNTYTIEACPLSFSITSMKNVRYFILDCADKEKEVSNSQVYNMNVNSGYRVTTTRYGYPQCNIFFNKRYLIQDPKTMNEQDTGRFLLNIRYVCVNILRYTYPELKEQFTNIGAAVAAVAIGNLLGLALTPTLVAKYFEMRPELAEAVMEKYDYEKQEFIGIPWLF